MNTPWGKSDSKTAYRRGVSFVSTPGHGGFMIGKGAAKTLSVAAQKRGITCGTYLAFEEDCDAFIILRELPDTNTSNIPDDTILMALSQWHADYLIELGITPNPKGLEFFNNNRLEDTLRREKSPNLIVAAFGDWATWVPKGRVGVQTADGKRYTVPAAQYAIKTPNLLSDHTDIQEAQ